MCQIRYFGRLFTFSRQSRVTSGPAIFGRGRGQGGRELRLVGPKSFFPHIHEVMEIHNPANCQGPMGASSHRTTGGASSENKHSPAGRVAVSPSVLLFVCDATHHLLLPAEPVESTTTRCFPPSDSFRGGLPLRGTSLLSALPLLGPTSPKVLPYVSHFGSTVPMKCDNQRPHRWWHVSGPLCMLLCDWQANKPSLCCRM
jgi:hypothetical protein